MDYLISPSILSADFARLGECIGLVEKAGADELHVDVMDGHFVPNLTLGPAVVRSIRRVTSLPLDVHLMVTDPAKWIEPFAQAGAARLTFHVETVSENEGLELLKQIRDLGIAAGLSLNPDTETSRLDPFLDAVDHVLLMSVFPGFGGQKFIEGAVQRAEAISKALDRRNVLLQVDGGIDVTRVSALAKAGVHAFIAGSSVFGMQSPADAVRAFHTVFQELSE